MTLAEDADKKQNRGEDGEVVVQESGEERGGGNTNGGLNLRRDGIQSLVTNGFSHYGFW